MGKMKRKKKGGWRDEVRQIPLSLSLFKTVAKPVEGIEIEDVKSSQILQDRIFGRRRNVGGDGKHLTRAGHVGVGTPD